MQWGEGQARPLASNEGACKKTRPFTLTAPAGTKSASAPTPRLSLKPPLPPLALTAPAGTKSASHTARRASSAPTRSAVASSPGSEKREGTYSYS